MRTRKQNEDKEIRMRTGKYNKKGKQNHKRESGQ